MKTVYFIFSLLMIGMISHLFQEYPMLVGCICFGIGIGYMREKNKQQSGGGIGRRSQHSATAESVITKVQVLIWIMTINTGSNPVLTTK